MYFPLLHVSLIKYMMRLIIYVRGKYIFVVFLEYSIIFHHNTNNTNKEKCYVCNIFLKKILNNKLLLVVTEKEKNVI